MWTWRKSAGYPVSSLRVPSRSRKTALRVVMARVRRWRRPPERRLCVGLVGLFGLLFGGLAVAGLGLGLRFRLGPGLGPSRGLCSRGALLRIVGAIPAGPLELDGRTGDELGHRPAPLGAFFGR